MTDNHQHVDCPHLTEPRDPLMAHPHPIIRVHELILVGSTLDHTLTLVLCPECASRISSMFGDFLDERLDAALDRWEQRKRDQALRDAINVDRMRTEFLGGLFGPAQRVESVKPRQPDLPAPDFNGISAPTSINGIINTSGDVLQAIRDQFEREHGKLSSVKFRHAGDMKFEVKPDPDDKP